MSPKSQHILSDIAIAKASEPDSKTLSPKADQPFDMTETINVY